VNLSSRVRKKLRRNGFVPRQAYAHYFISNETISSTIHLHNFHSIFFPDIHESSTARIWLHNSSGKLVAKKIIEIPYLGQIYLTASDLVRDEIKSEGMVYVDLRPSRAVRKKISAMENLDDMRSQTPFWVSYQDSKGNYMYVHSIELFRGRNFGLPWPLNRAQGNNNDEKINWKSWRLLDVDLLDELEIVVMNHQARGGDCSIVILDDFDEVVWRRNLTLTPRECLRIPVPQHLLFEWRQDIKIKNVRVGIEGLLTPNGKPYVIMRYGGGPQSLHHG
jgi:hypothetical protein